MPDATAKPSGHKTQGYRCVFHQFLMLSLLQVFLLQVSELVSSQVAEGHFFGQKLVALIGSVLNSFLSSLAAVAVMAGLSSVFCLLQDRQVKGLALISSGLSFLSGRPLPLGHYRIRKAFYCIFSTFSMSIIP